MQSRSTNNSRGIDISHYQTVSSWQKVRDSGIDFVLVKASQGAISIDPAYRPHVAGAHTVGLPVGAYHYLNAGDPAAAIAEAEHFASVIAGLPLELDPMLDIEDQANTPEAALAFLERFEQLTGIRATVYTFPSFINEKLGNALSTYRLHYAYYNADGAPADRGGWTEWTFLQYSEHGYVPGIDGPVDLDEFNGRVKDVFKEMDDLRSKVQALQGKVDELVAHAHMSCPDWAKEAVDAAVYWNIIDTPEGRSLDFYSDVVMQYREGVIKPIPKK